MLGACGDDGPSKSELIAEADKVCLDYTTRANALAEPQTQEELVKLLDKAIALAGETRTRLRAVRPSAGTRPASSPR